MPDCILTHPNKFYIGGRWVRPNSATNIDVINPANEKIYFRAGLADEHDVINSVQAARRAFDDGYWCQLSVAKRAEYLRAIGQEIAARAHAIADIWSSQMGIVRSLSGILASKLAHVFNYYADLSHQFEFEERRKAQSAGKVGLLTREPVGVVAAILPWNTPASLAAHKLAPALLAGCTIVLKAAPEAPGELLLMAEIFDKIGIPPGVVNVIVADREISERLVRDPGVDKVSFTGSLTAGRKIHSICSDRLARSTLELGGKSAALILDDYEVVDAVRKLAALGGAMAGQLCASLSRIILPRGYHDEFVDRLGSAYAKIRVGDPFNEATQMGPLASRAQQSRVMAYIESGIKDGARLVTGGGIPSNFDRGFFIEPTIFGNVDNSWSIAQDEIFGPVICVIPSDSEGHAIAIANDSIYGLNASVFTNDTDRAYSVARKLRTGTVGHNGFRADFGIAFGGFKQSGIGREGGVEGLLPYLETKTLILDGEPSHLRQR